MKLNNRKIWLLGTLITILTTGSNYQLVGATRTVNNIFDTKVELINDQIETEGTFSVQIGVDVSYNLKGMTADLNYDQSKIRIVNSECSEGNFDCTLNNENGKILTSSTNGQSGNYNIATFDFEILEDFHEGEQVEITLDNIEGANNTVGIISSLTVARAPGPTPEPTPTPEPGPNPEPNPENQNPSETPSVPDTGFFSNPVVIISVSALSIGLIAGIIGLIFFKKRKA